MKYLPALRDAVADKKQPKKQAQSHYLSFLCKHLPELLRLFVCSLSPLSPCSFRTISRSFCVPCKWRLLQNGKRLPRINILTLFPYPLQLLLPLPQQPTSEPDCPTHLPCTLPCFLLEPVRNLEGLFEIIVFTHFGYENVRIYPVCGALVPPLCSTALLIVRYRLS
jgi:hypothetical protein